MATTQPQMLPKSSLDTPALLVDLDVMEGNIARVIAICRENNVAWRPHAKAHKTPEIAKKLIDAGALGITCAKLSEAETMAAAGIRNILIANQIVGQEKITRLMALIGPADPIVAVDSLANVTDLAAAAQAAGKQLKVLIEVDIGMNRAGVEPGAQVVALAREITCHEPLQFMGLAGWEGHTATIEDPAEKVTAIAQAIGLLTFSARACREAGFAVQIVSCGGTGTLPYCAQQTGVTEVEAGGAIFGDVHYRDHYHVDFPFALTVLSTVTSRPSATRIVLDVGKKSMSGDAALPLPLNLPPASPIRLSAEHGRIELNAPSETPRIGDKIELVVGYSDTTVHLHEEMVGVRRGVIELTWCIAARGKLK